MPEWRNMAGMYPKWPRVVAIVDGTPFRISQPKGKCISEDYSHEIILSTFVKYYVP